MGFDDLNQIAGILQPMDYLVAYRLAGRLPRPAARRLIVWEANQHASGVFSLSKPPSGLDVTGVNRLIHDGFYVIPQIGRPTFASQFLLIGQFGNFGRDDCRHFLDPG